MVMAQKKKKKKRNVFKISRERGKNIVGSSCLLLSSLPHRASSWTGSLPVYASSACRVRKQAAHMLV